MQKYQCGEVDWDTWAYMHRNIEEGNYRSVDLTLEIGVKLFLAKGRCYLEEKLTVKMDQRRRL